MRVLETIAEVRAFTREAMTAGRSIGFVPTMGALHEGHLSLVRRSRAERDLTVVSIFVNPTQFGPGEDFEQYPRDLARDSQMLRREGTDALFVPSAHEMYPDGAVTCVEAKGLDATLCGPFRPGHFRGVATVVAKLLNIVRPTAAYFGAKDAQQAAIIRAMARDLDFDTEIAVCETVRESDGLALSSRNAYLSPDERRAAPALFRGLLAARRAAQSSACRIDDLRAAFESELAGAPFRIEYFEAVEARTLKPLLYLRGDVLLAAAVWLGRTRLIDNVTFEAPAAASSARAPSPVIGSDL